MAVPERSDEIWLRELRRDDAGGERARGDLRALLLTGIRAALGDRADLAAEDLAQDSVLRVVSCLDTFRGGSRFTTWATAVAMRVTFSELRRARWKDVSFEDFVGDAPEAPFTVGRHPDPERELHRARILDVLQAGFAGLTVKQRTVLAAELRGMPQDEICRELGTNRNALYKLAYDARQKLKQLMEARGISADDLRWAFED